jgi:transcriptional regulator GlxA family with amidase domain
MARALVSRLPKDTTIPYLEPLRAIALVAAVLAETDPGLWLPPQLDARVARATEAMDSQPGLPWPDRALARMSGMSVGGFVRLFRGEMGGCSPQAYLLAQRLARARTLLTQTELTLEAIAESCGFCDRSYFSTVFRRGVGIPPARYRQEGRIAVK